MTKTNLESEMNTIYCTCKLLHLITFDLDATRKHCIFSGLLCEDVILSVQSDSDFLSECDL